MSVSVWDASRWKGQVWVTQGCTNCWWQVTMATKFGIVASNIGSFHTGALVIFLLDFLITAFSRHRLLNLPETLVEPGNGAYQSIWKRNTLYLCLLSMKLALYHPSGARNFETVCSYVDSSCARGIR
jgi:hypothetical protein